MRGTTTHVLKTGESHIWTDDVGFEAFKISIGADGKAQIFINGKEFIS